MTNDKYINAPAIKEAMRELSLADEYLEQWKAKEAELEFMLPEQKERYKQRLHEYYERYWAAKRQLSKAQEYHSIVARYGEWIEPGEERIIAEIKMKLLSWLNAAAITAKVLDELYKLPERDDGQKERIRKSIDHMLEIERNITVYRDALGLLLRDQQAAMIFLHQAYDRVGEQLLGKQHIPSVDISSTAPMHPHATLYPPLLK